MIEANPGDKPRYTRSKMMADGSLSWFWEPPTKFRKQGCKLEASPLGSDMLRAFEQAHRLNSALDAWRQGRDADMPARHGTLDWVFELYRTDRSYRAIGEATRKEYERAMRRVGGHKLKDGSLLGQRAALKVTPIVVDKLYDRFVEQGLTRQAELAMTVCKLAWNVAKRKSKDVPSENPFENVYKGRRVRQRTTPATLEELNAFCETAVDLDYIELAFAARVCWELLTRPEDVFYRMTWDHWRPHSMPQQAFGLSGKNGAGQWYMLDEIDPQTGELHFFYPELEHYALMLAGRGRKGDLMVMYPKGVRKRSNATAETPWVGYDQSFWAKKVREIREKAGLGDHIAMKAFRHGGATELGDAELPDTWAQALSRHKHRGTLDHYIHRTDTQTILATRKRIAYRRAKNT